MFMFLYFLLIFWIIPSPLSLLAHSVASDPLECVIALFEFVCLFVFVLHVSAYFVAETPGSYFVTQTFFLL